MAYAPNPADGTQPVDGVDASTAAAEFRALKTYLQGIIGFGGTLAIGDIIICPAAGKPNYHKLDGAAINRVTYATLFANIGITFGPGDGATTFNLPTLAGPVANLFYWIKLL